MEMKNHHKNTSVESDIIHKSQCNYGYKYNDIPAMVPWEECNPFGWQCVTLMRPNESSFLISTEKKKIIENYIWLLLLLNTLNHLKPIEFVIFCSEDDVSKIQTMWECIVQATGHRKTSIFFINMYQLVGEQKVPKLQNTTTNERPLG